MGIGLDHLYTLLCFGELSLGFGIYKLSMAIP